MPASHLVSGDVHCLYGCMFPKVVRVAEDKSGWSVQFPLDASDLLVAPGATVLTSPGADSHITVPGREPSLPLCR